MKSTKNVLSLTNLDEIRLQLYLSRYGEWSRRKAADVIIQERVSVNGRAIVEPFFRVTLNDEITVDGKKLLADRKYETWMINKPIGYICSVSDPQGRPLAVSLIDNWIKKGLYNVGRLDLNSCGLLLLTNNGCLADRVMHPSYEIEKEYLVKINDTIEENLLKKFKKGFSINGINYKINSYKLINPNQVILRLNEGKNREIRRFFNYHDLKISLLKRVAIGGLRLNQLRVGESRLLSQKEMELIFSSSK